MSCSHESPENTHTQQVGKAVWLNLGGEELSTEPKTKSWVVEGRQWLWVCGTSNLQPTSSQGQRLVGSSVFALQTKVVRKRYAPWVNEQWGQGSWHEQVCGRQAGRRNVQSVCTRQAGGQGEQGGGAHQVRERSAAWVG